MALRYAAEPENGTILVREGLNRLSMRGGPLGGVDVNTLGLSAPHSVYDLRADAIAAGGGLSSASTSGIRYLVTSGGSTIAAAEILVDGTGAATVLANLNFGQFVKSTAQALPEIQRLAGSESYEFRLLRFSAIALMAIWLKSRSGDTDILFPLAPAPGRIEAERAYRANDFMKAILPLAQNRAVRSRAPMVP